MLDFLSREDAAGVRPVDLPVMRPQTAQRNRTLARTRAPMPFAEGMTVALVPEGRLDWMGAGKPVDLAFSVAGEAGALTTVMPVVQRLLERADLRVRPDRLDAELAAMAVETVLAEGIEALEQELGGAVALLNLESHRPNPALARLDIEIGIGGDDPVRYPATLRASAALLSKIARLWMRRPVVVAQVAGDVSVTLACRVAYTDLSVSALRALGVGDAMLFDRIAVPGGAAVSAAESLQAVARFDEAGALILSERFQPSEPYGLGDFLMTDDTVGEQAVQAIADTDLDNLPVRLVFEVGRVEMTLDDLRALTVGAPVPMDRPASSAVQVFANGRRIGAGEMVMIGEQLGVRITQLNGNA